MYLTDVEFKRLKELSTLIKSGKASEAEEKEYAELMAKKSSKGGDGAGKGVSGERSDLGKQDPEWWKIYGALMKDAANFPFNLIKGTVYETPLSSNAPSTEHYLSQTLGVGIHYTRSTGHLTSGDDPFNYQMRALYLTMHRKYRGLGKYQWMDLGMVIWATINGFIDIARAERIYGALSYYNVRNRAYPKKLLEALGLNPNTAPTGDDLADFRYQLNRIILKARTVCLPKEFAILKSFTSLEANVFKDSDSDRAAFYLYDSDDLWVYSHTVNGTYGGCVYTLPRTTDNGYYTFNTIIADLNRLFESLLNDDDVARIHSDIIAAFGEEGVMALDYLNEDYLVVPIKNDDRLLQLHNTTICGLTTSRLLTDDFITNFGQAYVNIRPIHVLWQDPSKHTCYFEETPVGNEDYLGTQYVAGPSVGLNQYIPSTAAYDGLVQFEKCALVDVWSDDVTEDMKIEATRQICTFRRFSQGGGAYRAEITHGNIIVNRMVVYTMKDNLNSINRDCYFNVINQYVHSQGPLFAASISQLDWFPIMLACDGTNNSPVSYVRVQSDLDNCVIVDQNTIRAIHDACMASGWKLASVGIV